MTLIISVCQLQHYLDATSVDSTDCVFPYASHPAPFDDPHAATTNISSIAASVKVITFFMLSELIRVSQVTLN